jgi:hypothetical protein
MFSKCFHSTKILPEFEETHGEYVKLDENKNIYLLHYKSIIKSTEIKNENSIILPKVEDEVSNLTSNNETLSSTNKTSDIVIGKNMILNNENENEKFLYLGVYKNCLNYLKNPELSVHYYKCDNEKIGYTIIFRRRLKQFYNYIRPSFSKENDRPLLFLIHGVGGSAKIWHKQISHFVSKGYELVIPDLLGHGKSTKIFDEHSYEFINLANDVLKIFDKYKRAKNIVIGHSYGLVGGGMCRIFKEIFFLFNRCSFTTYLAKMRTDVIDKIILISGGSPYPLDYKSPLLKFPTCLLHLMRPFINCTFFW